MNEELIARATAWLECAKPRPSVVNLTAAALVGIGYALLALVDLLYEQAQKEQTAPVVNVKAECICRCTRLPGHEKNKETTIVTDRPK